MTDDVELLRRYHDEKSDSAFAELVQRQAGLVYSAALRQVGGDTLLAQDVCQSVFIDLARKAGTVSRRPVLASWLYTSTRYAALKARRAQQRRQNREMEAEVMNESGRTPVNEADWEQLRPMLDAALCELPERDRAAVLMRYFEGRPFAEMGAKLGIGESSARMRAERALDKLRLRLGRKGITSTATALGLVLASQAVAAPPAGLVTALTGTALAQSAAASGLGTGILFKLSKLGAMKNLQVGAAAGATMTAAGVSAIDVNENTQSAAFFVYVVCFGVGLLFAFLSAFLGHIFHGHVEGHVEGGDLEAAQGHAEAGFGAHDMPGFAPVGPTTIATFITAFGGIGMVLTGEEVSPTFSWMFAAGGALGIAAIVGWGFSFVFRRTQSSSEGHVGLLVGQSATVISPIPVSGVGEIAYVQGGSRYSAPARAESGATFPGGTTVRIVRIVGTQFFVSSP